MTEDRAKKVEGVINGTEFFHVQRKNEDFVSAVIRAGGDDCKVTKVEVEEIIAKMKNTGPKTENKTVDTVKESVLEITSIQKLAIAV